MGKCLFSPIASNHHHGSDDDIAVDLNHPYFISPAMRRGPLPFDEVAAETQASGRNLFGDANSMWQ
jgi:hypothetical protein